ncbi:MAG: hypothetical protein P8R54_05805 [Myxococcota bacterium]|nr:hypothetical protein [Myxococcota bacterium]
MTTPAPTSPARSTIVAAELPRTAQSLERGQLVLHPLLLPSTVGVSQRLDLTFPLLGLLEGPSLALKWTALDTESLALSIEPFVDSSAAGASLESEDASGWDFAAVTSGATLRGTLPHGDHRLNLGTALAYSSLSGAVAVPLEVEFDLVISPRAVVRFGLGSDLVGDLQGAGNLSGTASWTHAWGRYRLALGSAVTLGNPASVWARSSQLQPGEADGIGLQPHLAMWWVLGGSGQSSRGSKTPYGWRHTWSDSSEPQPASPSALQLSLRPWSYGLSLGLGLRYLSVVEIPDGVAPRLDLGVVELRRSLTPRYRFGAAPARLDVQLDLTHAYWSTQATRWPRLPVCVYATWLRPTQRAHSLVLSAGLYTETGLDRFVRDEVLVRRPAGAVGAAGRIGRERHRRLVDRGVYLRGVAGVSLGADPDHPHVTRYLRLGVERSWLWGRNPAQGATP